MSLRKNIDADFSHIFDPAGPNKFSLLKIGMVVRVDNENYVCDVEFHDGGGAVKLPVNIDKMPDVGDLVLVGYTMYSNSAGTPQIISTYKTLDYAGKKFELDLNGVRLHTIKRYPGDWGVESNRGSFILLDGGFNFVGSGLGKISLDVDNNLINNVGNIFSTSFANRHLEGAIVRSLDGYTFPEDANDYIITESGKKIYIVTHAGTPADVDPDTTDRTYSFNEYRDEIFELTSLNLDDIVDALDNNNVARKVLGSFEYPLIEKVFGTAVGNRRQSMSYGKPFTLSVFKDMDTYLITPEEIICNNSFTDLTRTQALAAMLRFRDVKSREKYSSFFAVDKEGAAHIYLNKAMSSSLVPGLSMELGTEGSVKAGFGADTKGDSFRYTAQGRTYFDLKANNNGDSFIVKSAGRNSITSGNYSGQTVTELEDKYKNDATNPQRLNIQKFDATGNDSAEIVQGCKIEEFGGALSLRMGSKVELNKGAENITITNDSLKSVGGNVDNIIVGYDSRTIGTGSIEATTSGYLPPTKLAPFVAMGGVPTLALLTTSILKLAVLGDSCDVTMLGGKYITNLNPQSGIRIGNALAHASVIPITPNAVEIGAGSPLPPAYLPICVSGVNSVGAPITPCLVTGAPHVTIQLTALGSTI
ncbi:MAG: hypothetical protein WC783_00635 [Candidatus Paceibacterota bacterium]|jgi:hypothetical protein